MENLIISFLGGLLSYLILNNNEEKKTIKLEKETVNLKLLQK